VPAIVQPTYSFGSVVCGGEISHDFLLENPTDTPLEVIRIRTSCGCTAGKVEPETIPAHGTGRLHVVFKTGHRTGMQRKHVFISTRHPDAPLLRCSLEGTLLPQSPLGTVGGTTTPAKSPKPPPEPEPAPTPPAPKPVPEPPRLQSAVAAPKPQFRADPSALLLGSLPAARTTERDIRLSLRNGEAFAVTSCRTPLPGVTVAATPVDKTKTSWKLTVRVATTAAPTRLRGYLNISTDRSDTPLRILVTGKVVNN
jgi:hypothetical protein